MESMTYKKHHFDPKADPAAMNKIEKLHAY
jgi:hypothetical protein